MWVDVHMLCLKQNFSVPVNCPSNYLAFHRAVAYIPLTILAVPASVLTVGGAFHTLEESLVTTDLCGLVCNYLLSAAPFLASSKLFKMNTNKLIIAYLASE